MPKLVGVVIVGSLAHLLQKYIVQNLGITLTCSIFWRSNLCYLFLMSLKGCSSFSLFCSLMMPSDFISNTASSTVSSLTQTRLLAAKFLQPAAVLLSLLSVQSTDSPTAKIPLAPVISTFAFECFHWLAVF